MTDEIPDGWCTADPAKDREATQNKDKKDLHEGVTAVFAGVVAIACLIAGASASQLQ
jgi:hypothetical protein